MYLEYLAKKLNPVNKISFEVIASNSNSSRDILYWIACQKRGFYKWISFKAIATKLKVVVKVLKVVY